MMLKKSDGQMYNEKYRVAELRVRRTDPNYIKASQFKQMMASTKAKLHKSHTKKKYRHKICLCHFCFSCKTIQNQNLTFESSLKLVE